MGIIDTIKQFFQKTESGRDANSAMNEVKKAASRENYNQASINAFYALEAMGEVYVNHKREQHQTAREYGNDLVEEGYTTNEDLEPILVNFEIAKYSEMQVSSDDYSKLEESLNTVAKKLKSGRAAPTSSGKKRKARRRPRRGGKTGAARKRRQRSKEDN